jgi:hypothetical protein
MFNRVIKWLFKDTIVGWTIVILMAGLLFQVYLYHYILWRAGNDH